MVRAVVRPRDVFWLPFPGRNGITKDRCCVVLDSAPNEHNPDVVLVIAGCSETVPGPSVRVEATTIAFARLGLSNATTFHAEDIRFYDAHSPKLQRRSATCPYDLHLELRELADAWIDAGNSIPVLPEKASGEARAAAANFVAKKPS